MKYQDTNGRCDICDKGRRTGDHSKYSAIRKARGSHKGRKGAKLTKATIDHLVEVGCGS